jgi:serine/threonine protein kinase
MSSAAARPPASSAIALPPGTRLGEFEVLEVLGVGGFGIVYRAMDHALEREVAIKEYMPAMLAGRTETLHVSLRSQSDAETFALGLRSFVNEAKLLARFDHPALLKVYRFWEQHDTAYMAMPVYHGQTLRALRKVPGARFDEAWLRQMLVPLLGAIETLHAAGVYHRDIAPDNILIDPDGRPVLLDFGAARRVIGDRSQNLTAILKPAYAPIEQYAEASAGRQGPWTDLYALGATLYFLLTGTPPAPATARTLHDDVLPLTSDRCPGIGEGFLQAVGWMLALRPGDRPQSVAAWRAVLDGEQPAPAPTHRPPDDTVVDLSAPWPAPADAGAATVVMTPAPAAQGAVQRQRSRAFPLLAGLAITVAGLLWWLSRPATPPEQLAQAVSPAASMPASSVSAEAASATPTPATNPAPPPTFRDPPITERRADPLPAGRPPVRAATPPVRETVDAGPRPAAAPPASAAPVMVDAPLSVPTPLPAAAALSDDPGVLCGSRVLFALAWCMERKCASAENKNHPACRKWFAVNRLRPSP